MIIDRSHIIDQLFDFSQQGNGVIIGKPGIGKSYSVAELSEKLASLNIPVFILPIDMLPDGSDKSIEAEIDSGGNWVSYLDQVKLPNDMSKAVLFFDAFDAARDEELRKQYLKQIGKAISGLKKWNVIVSVRTYDATKSPQLLRLFEPVSLSSAIACRHFEIGELNEEELKSAFKSNSALGKMHDLGREELKVILRIPFFLRLLEIVLDGIEDADYEQIKLIKSETELLDKFWEKKISNTEHSYNKEKLLKKLSECLVQEMSLSFPKDDFVQEVDTFKELRSDDILSEVGLAERYVAFSHNILFDYTIGRLVIPPEPEKLVKFITDDKSRPFFLRPSIIFHFTRLWYNHRNEFLDNYHHLNKEPDVSITLFKRLIPMTVIANEFEQVKDLELILSEVASTQQLLQSVRFLNDRTVGARDIELLFVLSDKLDIGFLWDFSFVFQKLIIDELFEQGQYSNKFGLIARKFLEFILEEREKKPNARHTLDRLGSTRGIEYVAKTYSTNIEQSRHLLKRILEFLKESNFDIWYFSSLSDDIQYFAQYDPEFVAEIYHKIFAHQEKSTDETNMGGTITLNLRSNRRQDFEMCYFRLVEYFQSFIKIAPETALKTGLEIVNNYVIKDKLGLYNDRVTYQEVLINESKGSFLPDFSSRWYDSLAYYKPAQIVEKIIQYLRELIEAGDVKKLDSLLQIYFINAKVGFTWKKLIKLGNEFVSDFGDYLFQLALNESILFQDDTTYEIGISIQSIYPELNIEQREKIENAILIRLEDSEGEDKKYREQDVIRLLNCIPKKLLVKKESNRIVNTSVPVENQLTFRSGWSSEPYTTDKLLKDRGVDLHKEDNKEVFMLISQLESFNHQRLNDAPLRAQFVELLPIAKKLFQLKKRDGKYENELQYSAIKEVAKFYSTLNPQKVINNSSQNIVYKYSTQCLTAEKFHLF